MPASAGSDSCTSAEPGETAPTSILRLAPSMLVGTEAPSLRPTSAGMFQRSAAPAEDTASPLVLPAPPALSRHRSPAAEKLLLVSVGPVEWPAQRLRSPPAAWPFVLHIYEPGHAGRVPRA